MGNIHARAVALIVGTGFALAWLWGCGSPSAEGGSTRSHDASVDRSEVGIGGSGGEPLDVAGSDHAEDSPAGDSGVVGADAPRRDTSFDVQFIYDAPVRDHSLSPDTACAQTSMETRLEPLDIYFMLDHSSSMGADCPLGSGLMSKWCYATNALALYFQATEAMGHRAALQYFTLPNSNCVTGSPHDVAEVGLTLLPVPSTDPLVLSLEKNWPSTGYGTAIEAAERGMVAYTTQNRTPGRIMVGVLITDGDPNGCDGNVNNLGAILSNHRAETGIRTFIIGMTGATYSNLEAIALGGGAPVHGPQFCEGVSSCRYYSVADGDPVAFAAALAAIQQASVGCAMRLPTPDSGLINPSDVVVEYLPGGEPPSKHLSRASSAAQCTADGWYYDNNQTPQTITMCPAMCAAIQADPNAKTNVLFGCLGS